MSKPACIREQIAAQSLDPLRPLLFSLGFTMSTVYVQVGDETRMIFPSVDLESTFKEFKKIVAEKFGSSDFHLNLGRGYCPEKATLASKGVGQGTVLTLNAHPTNEARGKKRFTKGETKRSKYARLMEQGANTHDVAVDIHEQNSKTHQALASVIENTVDHLKQGVDLNQKVQVLGSLVLGKLTRVRADAITTNDKLDEIKEKINTLGESRPPANAPGEGALIIRVLGTFKVRDMNKLIRHWQIFRPPLTKREGKALLLVQKAPRNELMQVLDNPATILEGWGQNDGNQHNLDAYNQGAANAQNEEAANGGAANGGAVADA